MSIYGGVIGVYVLYTLIQYLSGIVTIALAGTYKIDYLTTINSSRNILASLFKNSDQVLYSTAHFHRDGVLNASAVLSVGLSNSVIVDCAADDTITLKGKVASGSTSTLASIDNLVIQKL